MLREGSGCTGMVPPGRCWAIVISISCLCLVVDSPGTTPCPLKIAVTSDELREGCVSTSNMPVCLVWSEDVMGEMEGAGNSWKKLS